jgi:hypothetical protein
LDDNTVNAGNFDSDLANKSDPEAFVEWEVPTLSDSHFRNESLQNRGFPASLPF